MSTLYKLTCDYQEFDDLLAECGGDISDPLVEAALDRHLAGLAENRSEKVGNYLALIREKQARAQARADEAKRLQESARREEKQAEALLKRLQTAFEAAGWDKVETRLGTVSLVKNGGKRPVVISADMRPEDAAGFRRVTVDFDKEAIRAALEAGELLGWAELGERGKSLRIR